VRTNAEVTFVAGTGITGIALTTHATVEGTDEATFQKIAEGARENCPVSQALKAVEITLEATLNWCRAPGSCPVAALQDRGLVAQEVRPNKPAPSRPARSWGQTP